MPAATSAGQSQFCTLAGSDEFLRGFSQRAIPQHDADASGCGRGRGIAGACSQVGTVQPVPRGGDGFAQAPVRPAGLGSSSQAVQKRAVEDEVEQLTQVITDRIIEMLGQGQ
jgi:hypothetical protein